MLRLIKADLRRIRKKKSFIICLLLVLFLQFFSMAIHGDDPPEELIQSVKNSLNGFSMLISTIFIYLSVFADDQQSKAVITPIARGMRRGQVLTAKLIDCIIFSAVFMLPAVGERILLINLLELPLSERQKSLLWTYTLFLIVKSTGCLAMAMLAQYLTDSTAAGIVTDVVAVMVLDGILQVLRTVFQINLYDYYFTGLLNSAFNNFAVGKIPWQLVPAVLVYVAAPIWIAATVNRRKEIDL